MHICTGNVRKGPAAPVLLMLLMLLLAACQSAGSAGIVGEPTAVITTVTSTVTSTATSTVTSTVTSTAVIATDDNSSAPGAAASPPIRLSIPALDFAVAVEPMAWRVTEVAGQRQAVWEVPAAKAGWHINSALPGTAGNLIISGHHLAEAAVFAPLARGEVTVGEQLWVTNADGLIFAYEVTEVSDPIPVIGASTAEQRRLERYQAATEQAALTLITGWPDFSDTHYLFVTADYVGVLE